jgi:molecular chaperone GrpE
MTKQAEKKIEDKSKEKRLVTKQQRESKERTLQKRLKEKDAELKKLKEQLLRTAAELENVRKRKDREIGLIIQSANDKLISDILPVLDDFERFFKVTEEHRKPKELEKGAALIYQKLLSKLTGYGVKPMESKGISFNVDEHDALLQVEKKGVPSGIVIEEHEKGYYINDRVLRHAKVVVSK